MASTRVAGLIILALLLAGAGALLLGGGVGAPAPGATKPTKTATTTTTTPAPDPYRTLTTLNFTRDPVFREVFMAAPVYSVDDPTVREYVDWVSYAWENSITETKITAGFVPKPKVKTGVEPYDLVVMSGEMHYSPGKWWPAPPNQSEYVKIVRAELWYGAELIITVWQPPNNAYPIMVIHGRVTNMTEFMYAVTALMVYDKFHNADLQRSGATFETGAPAVNGWIQLEELAAKSLDFAKMRYDDNIEEHAADLFNWELYYWWKAPVGAGTVLWNAKLGYAPAVSAEKQPHDANIFVLLEIPVYWTILFKKPTANTIQNFTVPMIAVDQAFWYAVAGPALSLAARLQLGPTIDPNDQEQVEEMLRYMVEVRMAFAHDENNAPVNRLAYTMTPIAKALYDGTCRETTTVSGQILSAAGAGTVVWYGDCGGPHMFLSVVLPSSVFYNATKNLVDQRAPAPVGAGPYYYWQLPNDIDGDGLPDLAAMVADTATCTPNSIYNGLEHYRVIPPGDFSIVRDGVFDDALSPDFLGGYGFLAGFDRYYDALPEWLTPPWHGLFNVSFQVYEYNPFTGKIEFVGPEDKYEKYEYQWMFFAVPFQYGAWPKTQVYAVFSHDALANLTKTILDKLANDTITPTSPPLNTPPTTTPTTPPPRLEQTLPMFYQHMPPTDIACHITKPMHPPNYTQLQPCTWDQAFPGIPHPTTNQPHPDQPITITPTPPLKPPIIIKRW